MICYISDIYGNPVEIIKIRSNHNITSSDTFLFHGEEWVDKLIAIRSTYVITGGYTNEDN